VRERELVFGFLSNRNWTLHVLVSVPSDPFYIGTGSSFISLASRYQPKFRRHLHYTPSVLLEKNNQPKKKPNADFETGLRWSVLHTARFETPSLYSESWRL